MGTRFSRRDVRAAAGAAAAVAVIAVAIVAVVLVSHHSSKPTPKASESLRLDPGQAPMRSRATAGGGQTASAISGGDYSTCALVRGQAVDCWGDAAYGQLGDGRHASSLTPVHVNLGKQAESLAVGGSHACALLSNRTVACWGANVHGELGDGSRTDSATPVPVDGIRDAAAIASGVAHSCAVVAGGVRCWGSNSNGQLGDGTTNDSDRPVAVQGLHGTVRAIAAGLAHTCALLADGSVACWGSNANGELGNGTTVDSSTAVAVTGLSGPAAAIDAGDAHTCALIQDGTVQCWGWNIEGQLGNGGGSDSDTPVQVAGLKTRATAIATGGSHTCALLATGGVECWGANLYGQLGNGTTSDSASPVPVSGLASGVMSIGAGLYHSCALLDGGSATCWGWNQQGQLGNGTTTSASSPVGVARLGLAPDGSGTVDVRPRSLPGSTKHTTIGFTFTVAGGGMHDGTLAITVPPGWSPPTTAPASPGYSTSNVGRVITTGRTISVTGLTLPSAAQVTVLYGNSTRGGPGARPRPADAAVWRVREQSSISGNLSELKASPVVRVLAADGSGEVATTLTHVRNGVTGRTIAFDYVASAGGVEQGTLRMTVPAGWSHPSTDPGAPGFVSASQGTVSVKGGIVSVSGLMLAGNQKLRIVYGDRRQGGPGAHAPSVVAGSQEWAFDLAASSLGKQVPLTASPYIDVLAPNGSGSVYGFESTVSNGQTGVTLSFTYAPASGGVDHGAFSVTVPPGWSPPSTNPGDPGYVTASVPKVTIKGRTITVPMAQQTSSNLQVTYGTGSGANAPSTNVGPQTWLFKERSTPGAKLKPLESSPTITVLSADGSGTLHRASGPVAPGSKGNTVVFFFEAAPGGLQDGTVTLTVPTGWSAPSTSSHDAGYVISTGGSISTSGQTITLTHVYLESGETLSVVYGSRSGGGPGASAGKSSGPVLWQTAEASTPSGKLKSLR